MTPVPRRSPFQRLYDWMLQSSRHPHAPWYLGAVSFAESSFFPIPPDVMLAPMTLAQPRRWARYALLTTGASVIGGILGYAIGHFLVDFAMAAIERTGHAAAYRAAVQWFSDYGFWAVVVAGFTPIPYKIFTIAAGAGAMPLVPFVLASVVGRGGRFFLVAGIVRAVGPRIEPHIVRNIDMLGWAFVLLLVAGFILLRWA